MSTRTSASPAPPSPPRRRSGTSLSAKRTWRTNARTEFLRGERRFRLVVVALGAITALGACSLFADTSGFTNGGTGALDATTDPIALVDTAVPTDAGIDAAVSVDAGRCDAAFCEDFDHEGLAEVWTETDVTAGGSAMLGTRALSPPNGLTTKITSGGLQYPRALLTRTVGSGNGIRCELSVYIESQPTATNEWIDFLSIQTKSGTARREIWLGSGNFGTLREDRFYDDGGCACPLPGHSNPPPFPTNKWLRVVYETTFKTQTLTVDGQVLVSGAMTEGLSPTAPIELVVGTRGADVEPGSVSFDDIRCALLP